MEFVFDMEENRGKLAEFEEYISEKRTTRGALMSVLNHGQKVFGYLPIEVQELISEKMGIPLAEIYGVVTFYSNFSLVPKGEHEIGVCMGTACYVRGAGSVLEEINDQLGIAAGQTTPDTKFSLVATRCVGACGLAPVVNVGPDVYGNVSADEVEAIIEKYRD